MMRCPNCGYDYCNANGLNPALARVVDFIHNYMITHANMSPTFEEIRIATKVAHRSTIFKHVKKLQALGILQYERYKPRSITLL